jgi:hypothetical protein
MHGNFLIADFMGEERCRCTDFGWDGLSRSIHYECGECKKHHMPSKFPYDTDLEMALEVVDKLRVRGIKTQMDNDSTMWKVTVDGNESLADTLNEALFKSLVQTLTKMKSCPKK